MLSQEYRKAIYRGIVWRSFLLIAAVIFPVFLQAQQKDSTNIFRVPIELDSFVVKSGFDINVFIRRVQNDTTFYKSFRSMHLVPYTAVNNIAVYDKRSSVIASLFSRTRQNVSGHCRKTEVLEQKVTGDFFKRNGDYNYYTAELFAYLFFAKDPVCNETDIVAGALEERGDGQMEKSKYQLKQLIFNPGGKVSGVPLMGDRVSIFEEDEARKYDFKVVEDTYDGQDCLKFIITPKDGYENKVLYNELTTWFRRSDYSILARDYSLSYSTLLYDFDVKMKVRTREIGNKLYPVLIDYDGDWHVFTKKRERVKFSVAIDY